MFKNELDKLTCSVPGCHHSHDEPLYLHARCHPKIPHQVVKSGCTIKSHCPRCGKIANAFYFKDERLSNAHWIDSMFLCQRCHPDQGIWTVYRPGSGVVTAVCRKCDQKVAEFTVPDQNADSIEVRVALTGADKVAAEWLWAVRVSSTTARLTNTPFFTTECTCGDLVEINQDREVTRVLERCGRPRLAHYQYDKGASPDALFALCQRLGTYLFENNLLLELGSHEPGLFALHVPTAITDSRLNEICAGAPVPMTLLPPGTNP